MGQYGLDDVGVVGDAQLVRNGEEKRIGLRNGFVGARW